MKEKFKYNELVEGLKFHGLILIDKDDEYNKSQVVTVSDGNYKATVRIDKYMKNDKVRIPKWFSFKNNPCLLFNINKYLEIHKQGNFICLTEISDNMNSDSMLDFKCTRCGTIIKKSFTNMKRDDSHHHGITCPNCDGNTESIHALVLKQMFKHYYPTTVEEERSCINPLTGAVLPTDIVNHELKIAIEVQGQWHRFDLQKERDRIKKDYWISRGYKFYDYEIEGVSVLDYIRYFFPDIEEIPEWVNMNYNKKINIIEAQQLLDKGLKVQEVADAMDVNAHRIYDSLHSNKLLYPDEYIKSTKRPVVMLDMNHNYLNEYGSFADAERANNIKVGLIASGIHSKTYYCHGYYWIPKDLYISGDYTIPENRTNKFYFPVVKYDMTGNLLATFDDMYQAAKDVGTIAFKIHEVANGVRKSIKGYTYKYK